MKFKFVDLEITNEMLIDGNEIKLFQDDQTIYITLDMLPAVIKALTEIDHEGTRGR